MKDSHHPAIKGISYKIRPSIIKPKKIPVIICNIIVIPNKTLKEKRLLNQEEERKD